MSRFLLISILVTALILIFACITPPAPGPDNPIIGSVISLNVQPQSTTYEAADQVIAFNFVVTNTGTAPLLGPVTVVNDKMTVLCPELNTIGNEDGNLDGAESITCAGAYTITQADMIAGSVTSASTASVGGINSSSVTTTITLAEDQVLTLTKSANPTIYSQVGQTITYSYTITNTGTETLGPAQFIVRDDRFPNPINCGADTTILATNQTVSCTALYTITQTDVSAGQVSNTASASGAGAGTIQNATVTITNTGNGGGIPGSGNYPQGSTVQHVVVNGEWMLQIARCYGAVFETVRNANPQVIDPDLIYPIQTLTVPNVGVLGPAYGPPCIKFYTVVSGDTWQSIANAHNADIEVLMEANKDKTLTAGTVIKVPLNSRMSGTIPPTAIPTRQPIPLNFPPGSPTVTVTGTIGTPDTIRYVFNGTAGQILSVGLTVPTNDVSLAVYGPNGNALKPLDTTTSWNGTLTATGQHAIDLVSTLGSTNKTYTLEVTLTTPTAPSPVERVSDINTGVNGSNPSYLSVFNNQLYFQADAGDGTGAELWRYDSGLNAATRVNDINPGTGGSEPAFLTTFGDFLYFRANGNDGGGSELWRFNGSAAGRVTDINTGAGDANPMYLTVFNDNLYFSANGNDGFGTELWRFDGTVSTRVSDINPDAGDSSPAYLEVFNNELYFSATSNDGTGTELWKYDGTNAPTRVADINTGIGNSNPAFMTSFSNALYFSADDGTGTELWRFDGTTATRAADINPGAAASVPTFLEVFNNALYFSANGDAAGFELWRFDGTNASRVADINPAGNSNPAYLTVYNNQLYFQATGNDNAGAELWRYTGQ
jgi:uncharacterized repeat protein (TIGR01451 family)